MNRTLDTLGAWLLGLLWILPLAYAAWAAFHPPAYATRFDLLAPLTLENFARAWNAAPFPRYFLNTFLLVTMCCPRWRATPSRASSSAAATSCSCWCCCS